MNRQVRGRQSKRVAEYFVVVGWNYYSSEECTRVSSSTVDNLLDFDITVPFQTTNEVTNPSIPSSSSPKSSSSSSPRSSSTEQNEDIYTADIIDRYPVKNYDDFPFPEGIPLFCFPSGLEVEIHSYSPRFYSFVSTSEDGARLLGSCLRFYEPIPPKFYADAIKRLVKQGKKVKDGQNIYMPKCICLISKWPFSLAFKKVLCSIYRLCLATTSTGKTKNASNNSNNSNSNIHIPIERYICNFIDDVPAPPWGRLDVIYYIAEDSVSFRCPPYNEPNAWSSFPLYPLFECLDPNNIMILFNLVLTERQIVFISSQYSLLTSCGEAITSLMYPITWAHAYIPVLPLQLLGVLGAPFPYILGMHSSFLENKDCNFSNDSARVYLDENKILFGDEFIALPELPERRAKKLYQVILDAAPIFANRMEDWEINRLPYFDDAFSPLASQPPKDQYGKKLIDETKLREGFLKFFVAILMNYRKYLVYNSSSTQPLNQFRSQDFLSEQPSDWQPFLKEMISTQSFSIFVDERVSDILGSRDVMFFDESIDAKLNRYTFRLRNIDTPFLLNNAHKHTKTYVTPSPDTSNLSSLLSPEEIDPKQQANRRVFPRLRQYLYSPPRQVKVPFDPFTSFNVGWSSDRLKRMAGSSVTSSVSVSSSGDRDKSHDVGASSSLSQASSLFSIYLVTVSNVIIMFGSKRTRRRKMSAVGVLASTSRLLDEFGSKDGTSNIIGNDETTPEKLRRKSSIDGNATTNAMNMSGNQLFEIEGPETSALRIATINLGLKVAFEALDCLTRLDQPPGEIAYRSLFDACGVCGDFIRSVDLLVYMNSEGLLPDRLILTSVARAYVSDPNPIISHARESGGHIAYFSKPITTADVLTIEDWRPIRIHSTSNSSNSNSTSTTQNHSSVTTRSPTHATTSHTNGHTGGSNSSNNNSNHSSSSSNHSSNITNSNGKATVKRGSETLSVRPLTLHIRPSAPFTVINPSSRNTLVHILFGGNSPPKDSSHRKTVTTPTVPPHQSTPHKIDTKRTVSTSALASGTKDPKKGSNGNLSNSVGVGVGVGVSVPTLANISEAIASLDPSLNTVDVISFPTIQWSNLNDPNRLPIYSASKKLHRQMRHSEKLLTEIFPDLAINLQHPLGLGCPNKKCNLGRPLTVSEVYRGWKPGDPNTYTTRCMNCQSQFVPRFTVTTNNIGGDLEHELWCELLSPWTLRKEVYTAIFQDGIADMISPEYRSLSSQKAVLFWNLIVVFRLIGLPYAFLLSDGDYSLAFPQPESDPVVVSSTTTSTGTTTLAMLNEGETVPDSTEKKSV